MGKKARKSQSRKAEIAEAKRRVERLEVRLRTMERR